MYDTIVQHYKHNVDMMNKAVISENGYNDYKLRYVMVKYEDDRILQDIIAFASSEKEGDAFAYVDNVLERDKLPTDGVYMFPMEYDENVDIAKLEKEYELVYLDDIGSIILEAEQNDYSILDIASRVALNLAYLDKDHDMFGIYESKEEKEQRLKCIADEVIFDALDYASTTYYSISEEELKEKYGLPTNEIKEVIKYIYEDLDTNIIEAEHYEDDKELVLDLSMTRVNEPSDYEDIQQTIQNWWDEVNILKSDFTFEYKESNNQTNIIDSKKEIVETFTSSTSKQAEKQFNDYIYNIADSIIMERENEVLARNEPHEL